MRPPLPVTLDAMVHHTRAVSNGATRALVVADMPFLTYQASIPDAVRNAGRLIQEGGAAAVKMEGGRADRRRRASGSSKSAFPSWATSA